MTCSRGRFSHNVRPVKLKLQFESMQGLFNELISKCLNLQFFAVGKDLGSGAMICGVLFSISSVADHVMTPKFFHVAFFYSGLIIQLYSNCFYGSQVFVAVMPISWNFPRAFASKLDQYLMDLYFRVKTFDSMRIFPIGKQLENIHQQSGKHCQWSWCDRNVHAVWWLANLLLSIYQRF